RDDEPDRHHRRRVPHDAQAGRAQGGRGMTLLAYRPFIDYISADRWWYLLLIPMALGIALAYKAVRVPDLKDYPREVAIMTVQIIVAMIVLGVASYLFVQYIVPAVVPK